MEKQPQLYRKANLDEQKTLQETTEASAPTSGEPIPG